MDAVRQEHLADFNGFLVEYDNYYTTHSEENRHYSELIFAAARTGTDLHENVEQLYDAEKGLFLPIVSSSATALNAMLTVSMVTTARAAARLTTPLNSAIRNQSTPAPHQNCVNQSTTFLTSANIPISPRVDPIRQCAARNRQQTQ